jgi:hypothetical protein
MGLFTTKGVLVSVDFIIYELVLGIIQSNKLQGLYDLTILQLIDVNFTSDQEHFRGGKFKSQR